MTRLVLLLFLTAACSSTSEPRALPTPTPPPSALPTASVPSPPATVPASPTATAAGFSGPAGTPVPPGFSPSSATFISDRTGWVLGASPCPGGTGSCDVIARTTDGGATWRAIPSPRTTPDRLAQIRFADVRNGFVTGDQLWATHDGGATWNVVPGATGTRLVVADGRAWYADGSRLYSAPVTGGAFVREPGAGQTGLALYGPLAVSGTDTTGTSLLRQTHGQPPAKVPVPCEADTTAVVGLGSATRWFLVCEGGAGMGKQQKTAFQSLDAGRTWRPAGQPPPEPGTEISVTSDGTFVVDNQQVAVYRGGAWRTALASNGGLSEGGFASAALGFAIGAFDGSADAVMKLTRDAGRTWTTVRY